MRIAIIFVSLILMMFASSCREETPPADEPAPVLKPEDMDAEVSKSIKSFLSYALDHAGAIDSSALYDPAMLQSFYSQSSYKGAWSSTEEKAPVADSLLAFILQSKYYGLYPEHYHLKTLSRLHEQLTHDSAAMKDAGTWTKLDLFSTDAFFRLLKDLKEGRIVPDSLSIVHKPEMRDSFFIPMLQKALSTSQVSTVMQAAEPTFFKYRQLRAAIPAFVDGMDDTRYAQIIYPFEDSMKFVRDVYARFVAAGLAEPVTGDPDSATFRKAVRKFQLSKRLEADGKPGTATVKELNNTDDQKFRSIAISLDRYKQLREVPSTFVWVNIPSFHLQVLREDTVILDSRIIVGKPATPTPELRSNINNLVVYPNWTIPASIIKKEILPALKKDPEYLSRKGYNLFDEKGEMINPYGINWTRYSTGIPWRVVQGSGDDNALGVFKFNFANPHSVYLHDTNQRYLFGNTDRALSHGCVRVQKWQQLADIIALRDSSLSAPVKLNYSEDSIRSWVSNGVRKSITVRNRFPLYIVYYTCEADGDNIEFYPDIYNEDARLYSEYFKKM